MTARNKIPEVVMQLGDEHASQMLGRLIEVAPDWALPGLAKLLESMTALGLKFTIALVKAKHTPNQRNYYHLCCGLLADHLGYTHDEMHDIVLRTAFGTNERAVLVRNGFKITSLTPMQRSSKLPVDEYSELIEALMRLGAFNDFTMPDPEHYHVDDRIAAQIRMQREVSGQ